MSVFDYLTSVHFDNLQFGHDQFRGFKVCLTLCVCVGGLYEVCVCT